MHYGNLSRKEFAECLTEHNGINGYINDQTNIIMRNVRTNQGIDLQENIGFRNRLLRCGYSNGIQS